MNRKVETTAAVILLIISILLFLTSLKYPYYYDGLLGPGFAPTWVCGFLIVTSILILIQAQKIPSDKGLFTASELHKLLWIIVIIVVSLFLVNVLGMVVTLGLMTATLVYFLSRQLREAIYTLVMSPVIIYFIFKLVLKVNFPKGFLGI